MKNLSFNNGDLSIVTSPIGNLDDMTFRAVNVLRSADIIASENVRRTKILLGHYEIECPMISYNKDNESKKTQALIKSVKNGQNVAMLVSAGTPSISDPGFLLVRQAVLSGIEPVIIPGVSALTYAIVASGFPVQNFCFLGFLTKKKLKRRKILRFNAAASQSLFIFESPFRITQLLQEIADEIGSETEIVLVREATKKFEEHIRGTAESMLLLKNKFKEKGEFTVAVNTYHFNETEQQEF